MEQARAHQPVLEGEVPGGDVSVLPILDDRIDDKPLWRPPPHEGWVRFGVFVFACAIFLPNLGGFGLWDPWETHYGAVTTEMLETHEWVSPWWGYKGQIGSEPKQGEPFYSKPVFTFWTEAMFSSLIGRGELAIRLPMALLAILATLAVFLAMSKLWGRRAGLIGALVIATSPQFFMISRQAQTDMPFVGTMTIAMCFAMLAFFGPREQLSRRGFWAWIWGTLTFLLINTIPQFAIIATDLNDPTPAGLSGLIHLLSIIQHTGILHVAIYAVVLVVIVAWFARDLRRDLQPAGLTELVKDRWLRRCYLVIFYAIVAQATYAKGLLGFGLPGVILLVHLIFSGGWKMLRRAEIPRGVLISLVVGLPWYVAMFARHGWPYYQRFFIHDHFNRLAAGVHQIDSGNFEHFIKWLGFGMFPWAVFVPLTLGLLVRQGIRDRSGPAQAKLFLTFWFVTAFTFFTLSSTKFHHYIFPALPALAMLVALFLDDLLEDRSWLPRLAAVLGVLLFLVFVRDLAGDHQHLRNLMTYKYDRPLPDHLPIDPTAVISATSTTTWGESTFWQHISPAMRSILSTEIFRYDRWMMVIAVAGLLALLLFLFARTRRAGLVAMGATATALTMWALSYYMATLAPHWSQKYLFDTYYDTCTLQKNPPEIQDAYTPLLARIGAEGLARTLGYEQKRVCVEDVISWRITWRGETYYSYNELLPIGKENEQFLPYLEEMNHGKPFYALMERGKMSGFESRLNSFSDKLRRKGTEGFRDIEKWEARVVNDESEYFQMVRADPVRSTAE
ncbi:MAG: glycosyltransferase family 39 protein [Deltaproteobacteria bacterium]|nr:glycosyltransferase family 39 protein [Deltaproteobacteria bacterium]MCB9787329.1 glycosyltransferase family 39 protein [Deltaproteobacteria bacterium]